jgi:hypothetical protein
MESMAASGAVAEYGSVGVPRWDASPSLEAARMLGRLLARLLKLLAALAALFPLRLFVALLVSLGVVGALAWPAREGGFPRSLRSAPAAIAAEWASRPGRRT